MFLPNIAVGCYVSVEVGWMAECFVAVWTLVRGGGAVSCFVLLKMGLLSEPFMAHRAFKWTFT